ncbi:hypothetical protein FA13DRAFT_1795194 [Coprinellus micaceus]|uniref:Uncharacterized protein n=1 Tax=Coprinellus micaceus TaxID=71717 RepID=A0A4Y7SYK1_COPMI|nr:hypothetical protein FA13DRAFT_1795194 [Coprinellus micaceus]
MQQPSLLFDSFIWSSTYTLLFPLPYHLEKADQATNELVPEPSDELKGKLMWMQCVVQNKTQFLIVHDSPAYISSSSFDKPPQNINPYSNMAFTVCTCKASMGVAGGVAFCVILNAAMEYPFAPVTQLSRL